MGQGWKTVAMLFCCMLRIMKDWGRGYLSEMKRLLTYHQSAPDVLRPDLG